MVLLPNFTKDKEDDEPYKIINLTKKVDLLEKKVEEAFKRLTGGNFSNSMLNNMKQMLCFVI